MLVLAIRCVVLRYMSCVKSQVGVTASTDRPGASCRGHCVDRTCVMLVHMLPKGLISACNDGLCQWVCVLGEADTRVI
jgi:hypothetical protein